MKKVNANKTPHAFVNPAPMFLESMEPTFAGKGDVMPKALIGKRKKFIHQRGTVGKVKFVSNGKHSYSGVLQGADSGIVRFSSAAQPKKGQPLGPGMGVKFLRDGQDSANFVAMFGVNGQTSWNFFEHEWNTWVPAGKGAALNALGCKFRTATAHIGFVGMSDMASIDAKGNKVKSPKVPFGLTFVPKSNIKGIYSKINGGKTFVDYLEYMNTLKKVPANSALFDVYAKDDPKGKRTLIGTLELEGSLTPSSFGDQSLFFRHQKKEDDFKTNPEHKNMSDTFKCPMNPINWAKAYLSGSK